MLDKRQLTAFLDQTRDHTLANLRDHLMTLARIQEALTALEAAVASCASPG